MNNDFAVFIMVYGRPKKMWTYSSLRVSGYTGKIFLVGDDTDIAINDYKEKYKDELLIFDKKEAAGKMDAGDNSGDLRSTLFAANTIFDLAKERGIKYFMIMCDDYTGFHYNHNTKFQFKRITIKNLDGVFGEMIKYYKETPALTMAMTQGGDFIGGKECKNAGVKLTRKAMNTFLCSTDRPFQFMGRLNEDVTTYVNLGGRGKLFLTITNIRITQKPSQSEKGGLTEVYLDSGTYMKSFFSVMYSPSCVRIGMIGETHLRIHHRVKWNNAVPVILDPKYKK